MIELDGSHGEGGGALVRTALALSFVANKAFRVTNIRAGRPTPGLKAQHLTCINALKQMSNSQTNEIRLGSKTLEFIPGIIKPGKYDIDIGTAGSISLVLQALLLPCIHASGKTTLTIKGGTCGKWQASVDYIKNVTFPQLRKFVEKIDMKILKRGYYPKGGGIVEINIVPRKEKVFAPIVFKEDRTLEQIRGVVNVSSDLEERQVAQRIKQSAMNELQQLDVPISIQEEYARTLNTGGDCVLWAVFSTNGDVDFQNPIILASNALIEKNISSQEVGKTAADRLIKEIKGDKDVDHYLQDQLISFMRSGSKIRVGEVTNHTLTNIYVAEKFLPLKFKVERGIIFVE